MQSGKDIPSNFPSILMSKTHKKNILETQCSEYSHLQVKYMGLMKQYLTSDYTKIISVTKPT